MMGNKESGYDSSMLQFGSDIDKDNESHTVL